MTHKKRKSYRQTEGITLRLDVGLLQVYREIALRANKKRVLHGEPGNVTTQDVMRHRLGSLPVVKLRGNKG